MLTINRQFTVPNHLNEARKSMVKAFFFFLLEQVKNMRTVPPRRIASDPVVLEKNINMTFIEMASGHG